MVKTEKDMDRLLVVDDDPDILDVMEMFLTTSGYSVASTGRGQEVPHMVQTYKPDLIILDYLLSGMDGTAICKRLKSEKETRHIPVIMFSASPDAEVAAKAAGAEGYVSKPFSVNVLLDEIKKYVS